MSSLHQSSDPTELLIEHRREANKHAERLLFKFTPIVLCVSSLSTLTLFLPFLGLFTGPVIFLSVPSLLIAHAILLRFWFVNPPQPQFSLPRRLISRWVPRLVFIILAPWGYGFMSVPWLGLIAPPVVFTALTVFTHRYIGWQIQRQSKNQAIHIVEKFFIGGLVAGAFLSVILFCAVAYGLGVLVELLYAQIQAWG